MRNFLYHITIACLVCLASCHRQVSTEMALAQADSLVSAWDNHPDSIPAIRLLLQIQRTIDALSGNDTVSLNRKANLLASMGDLFAAQLLYNEAVNRYQLSYNMAEALQDTLAMTNAYKRIGDMYRSQHDLGEAVHYYDLAEQLADQGNLESLRVSLALRIAVAFIEDGRLNLAVELLPTPPYQVASEDEDIYNYVMWHIYSFTDRQHSDSAVYFLNKLIESEDIYYRNYANDDNLINAIQKGDSKEGYRYYRQKERLYAEMVKASRNEAIESVKAMYQSLNTERENTALQAHNQRIKLYAIFSIVLLVIVIATSVIIIERIMNERMRLERNNALLEKYNATLQANLEAERSRHTEESHEPFVERNLAVIRTSPIYQHLLVTERVMNSDEQAEISNLLSQLYPDFLPRLQKFGVVKEHDLKVCLLLKMGFKPSRIASLVSRSDSAIANTRARLYKKVFGKDGRADEWDKVIMSL